MIYWVWLTTVPDIGPVTANKLLKKFGKPEAVYHAAEKDLISVNQITKSQINRIVSNRSLESAKRILDRCDQQDIHILTQSDPCYPKRAKEPEDAPILLYYKGRLSALDHTVGIVGARRCTQETKKQVIALTEACVDVGMTVISGMAKGVDSYAHTVCLEHGGHTIAVLGNGLDICYPKEHNSLMECIIQNGFVISEYPPGTPPARYHFPKRNRLISAWSDQLYAIAPGKGSGAWITVEYAKQYGKPVFANP